MCGRIIASRMLLYIISPKIVPSGELQSHSLICHQNYYKILTVMEIHPETPSDSNESTFKLQFSRKNEMYSRCGNVKFCEIAPNELADTVPVVLAAGWAETPNTHMGTLETIFSEERRGISLEYPRKGGTQLENKYPEVELKKAEALLAVIEDRDIDKVDVIAHSEGAINAIIAAQLRPDKFRNIVFVEPAGLIGNDNLLKLASRFTLMLSKEGIRLAGGSGSRKVRLQAAREAVKYFSANPVRACREAKAISAADIYEMLESLEKVGIKVSVIHGVDDTVFPMKKLLDTARQKDGIPTIGFYSVKGDHREISVHPEKYTALAINALS